MQYQATPLKVYVEPIYPDKKICSTPKLFPDKRIASTPLTHPYFV